jgi:outer membrane biosynthesis protein TonB
VGIRMSDVDTAQRQAGPDTQVSGPSAQRPAPRTRQAPRQTPRQTPTQAPGKPPRQTPRQAPGKPPRKTPRQPPRVPLRTRRQPAEPARTAPAAAPSRVTTAASRVTTTTIRMPFIVLVCGLLGGTLLSLLVISTTLAEGSFRITNLQSQLTQLSRQRQQLEEQVATAQSAQMIGERAYGLGMRPPGELRFIDLKTGRVRTDAGTGAVARISVPGYTP